MAKEALPRPTDGELAILAVLLFPFRGLHGGSC